MAYIINSFSALTSDLVRIIIHFRSLSILCRFSPSTNLQRLNNHSMEQLVPGTIDMFKENFVILLPQYLRTLKVISASIVSVFRFSVKRSVRILVLFNRI